ncbi:MAG: hypothetical protein O2945_19420, partial [Planctomycetota bacterium]|nr:hypothetical protein [Planctomycetota bacterium]
FFHILHFSDTPVSATLQSLTALRNGDSSGYSAVAAKEQTTRRRRERPLNPKDGRSFHQRVGSHGVVSGVVSRTDQRPDET